MPTEIVTTDDLREFKIELLDEMKKILLQHHGHPAKKWLKSYEVRELLDISPGTLQCLRENGTLPFTKLGRSYYYDFDKIKKILEGNPEKKKFRFNQS